MLKSQKKPERTGGYSRRSILSKILFDKMQSIFKNKALNNRMMDHSTIFVFS